MNGKDDDERETRDGRRIDVATSRDGSEMHAGRGYRKCSCNTVLPRASAARSTRRSGPATLLGFTGLLSMRLCRTIRDGKDGEPRHSRRTRKRERCRDGGTNERLGGVLVVVRCGERRKRSVRLISAAGADKALVHSPTTENRPMDARARAATARSKEERRKEKEREEGKNKREREKPM